MMSLFGVFYNVFALLIFFVGAFVLYDNYRNHVNAAFFFYALGAFGWMVSLYWGYSFVGEGNFPAALTAFRFAYAFSIFAMSFMTIFFYLFPRVTWRFSPPSLYAFYALTILLFGLSAFSQEIHSSLIVVDNKYMGDNFGDWYPIYSFHILLNLALSILFSIHTYLKVQSIEKKKVAYAILGYVAFVTLAVVTNVVLPLFNIFPFQREVPLLSVFFLIPAFIAMSRFRFFNLSYFSFNLIRKVFLYGSFLLVAILLLSLTNNDVSSNLASYAVGIILLLYLYELISGFVPHFVPGNLKELKRGIGELRSQLYHARSFAELKKALDDVFVLHLNYVSTNLYIIRKSNDGISVPVYQPDSFTEALQKIRNEVLIRDEVDYMKLDPDLKSALLKEMNRMGDHLYFPLFSEENLIGFLALKRKEDQYSFSKEEVKELAFIKRPLEISLMNYLLKLNLEEENNLMRRIIDRKTKQLKKKIEEINELLKQQADFIAITAHEFRTPLTIATFQIENLLRSKIPASEMIKGLRVLDNSINNVKSLTERLFKVQQYDLNKVFLHPEKVNLTAFTEGLFTDFSPIMKEKGIRFEFKKGSRKKLMALIDESQFRQVLHNLLNNAFKFTPPNGQVELAIKEGTKGLIEISIDDNGSGIPDNLKQAVFEKFRTKAIGSGIGLGLYLCKKIIALHKGRLWAEDSPLGGTSFQIRIKRV